MVSYKQRMLSELVDWLMVASWVGLVCLLRKFKKNPENSSEKKVWKGIKYGNS